MTSYHDVIITVGPCLIAVWSSEGCLLSFKERPPAFIEESSGGYFDIQINGESVAVMRRDGQQDEFSMHSAQTQFPADKDFSEGPPTWFLEYMGTSEACSKATHLHPLDATLEEETLSLHAVNGLKHEAIFKVSSVEHAQYSSRLNVLATAHRDTLTMTLMHSTHHDTIASLELPGTISCLRWSRDGQCLAVAIEGVGVHWYDGYGALTFQQGEEQLGVYAMRAMEWMSDYLVMLPAEENARHCLLLQPYLRSMSSPSLYNSKFIYLAHLDVQLSWRVVKAERGGISFADTDGERVAWISHGALYAYIDSKTIALLPGVPVNLLCWLDAGRLAVHTQTELVVLNPLDGAIIGREEVPDDLDYLQRCSDGCLVFITRCRLIGIRHPSLEHVFWGSLNAPEQSIEHHHWQVDSIKLGEIHLVFILRGTQLSCLELPGLHVSTLIETGVRWFRLLGQGSLIWLVIRRQDQLEIRRYPFDQSFEVPCSANYLLYPHNPTFGMLVQLASQECKSLGDALYSVQALKQEPLAPHLIRLELQHGKPVDTILEQVGALGMVFEYLLMEADLQPEVILAWSEQYPSVFRPALVKAARKMEPGDADALVSQIPGLFEWCLANDLEAAGNLWVLVANESNLLTLLDALLQAKDWSRLSDLLDLADRIYPDQVQSWREQTKALLRSSGRCYAYWKLFGDCPPHSLDWEQRIAGLITDLGGIPHGFDQLEEDFYKQLSDDDGLLWKLMVKREVTSCDALAAVFKRHAELRHLLRLLN